MGANDEVGFAYGGTVMKTTIPANELELQENDGKSFWTLKNIDEEGRYVMVENPDTRKMVILTFPSEEVAQEFVDLYNLPPNIQPEFIAARSKQ